MECPHCGNITSWSLFYAAEFCFHCSQVVATEKTRKRNRVKLDDIPKANVEALLLAQFVVRAQVAAFSSAADIALRVIRGEEK